MKIPLYSLGILLTLVSGALLAQQSAGYSINTVAGGHVLGDNGPAKEALLFSQEKIITDASGVMYIADTGWHRVRRVDASGRIETIAGTGVAGFSGDGQAATAAQLKSPVGLALYKGDLYVADSGNNRIRRITTPATSAGIISTVAGATSATQLVGPRGLAFDASGNLYITDWALGGRLGRLSPKGEWEGLVVGFSNPGGIAMDPDGNILVADTGHHVVRRITPAGEATIVAGSGYAGFGGDRGLADGSVARLNYPSDVTVDRLGTFYIADSGNGRIRKVMHLGNQDLIFTEAGGGQIPPFGGEYTTEDPFLAALSSPRGVWVDAAGAVYIADTGYSLVRKLEAGTLKIIAGASRSFGDGGKAISASLYFPRSVAVAADGNLLIADTSNHKIRKVWPDGKITTFAGAGLAGDTGDGARAEVARLNAPAGLAIDSAGNVYIGDTGNARLRKVRPSGDIVTIAGGNGWGGEGDGLGPTSAQVKDINGIALDAEGNIYLADTGNNRIRKIMKDGSTIERFAGTAASGAGADAIRAVLSAINSPHGVVVGKDGSIYFSDTSNHRVRRVLPNLTVETVAGTGAPGYFGDGGAARSARLNNPRGLAMDAEGNLYIADTDNHRIRNVNSGGFIRTIAGTGVGGWRDSDDGGAAISAQLWFPTGVALDSRGNIYVADQSNHRIRRLTADISNTQLTIAGGNNQSASTGAKLPVPLAVRLTNRAGAPVAGVSISFVITRGLAQLSAGSAVTNADGVASVTITLGAIPGDVAVSASASGVLPVQFQLTTLGAVVTGQPRIFSGGVVGAGLSIPAVRQLSPNGLYTIFGENFAQPEGGWAVGPADLVNGQVPTRFQGVCVRVGGALAPVIHVYPKQVSFQAPNLSASLSVGVQVILNCGEGEVKSNVENVEMRVASPEFLFFVQNADGRNAVKAIDAVTGAFVGPSGLIAGGNFVPAKPGDYVTIFGSGFGATNPLFFAGDLADRAAPVTALVSVTLGGRPVAASDILYAGATPGFAGLYQVNLRIPEDAADGNLPLVISVSGVPSPDGAYLSVKR